VREEDAVADVTSGAVTDDEFDHEMGIGTRLCSDDRRRRSFHDRNGCRSPLRS
jgi:hypothetical protein